uniref:Uncharacterized protein n=1 Tax=Oryza brachyantha TaxID=4533 RepID=J3MKT9_ORYBR
IRHKVNHRLSGLPDGFYHRSRPTIDNNSLTGFILLCSPKSSSSQNLKTKVLNWNPILRILMVPENPA